MTHNDQERVTALAGIYQSIACVMRIARAGSADAAAIEPCIYSLFQVDAANVAAVYGHPGALANGARQIVAQLTGKPDRDLELTRYVVTVLKLERALARRADMLARVGEGVAEAETLRAEHALLDPPVLAHFARVYSETVSRLEPRILVRGEPVHLKNPDNQDRIRALLLAAIRSARLWRQIGGTRLHILFGQKRLLQDARRYLEHAAAPKPEGSAR